MANNIQLSASAPAFVPSPHLNASQTSRAVSNRDERHVKNMPTTRDSSEIASNDDNALSKEARADKADTLHNIGYSIVLELGLEGKFAFQDPEWVNSTIDKVFGWISIYCCSVCVMINTMCCSAVPPFSLRPVGK